MVKGYRAPETGGKDMDVFTVELSGIPIEIQSRYHYCRWYCRSFFTDRYPLFSVFADENRLNDLRERCPDMREELLERDAIYSVIASRLPSFNRAVLHGACISYHDKGYLFAAASGTGKTTHIRLWRQFVGAGVDIVNGDKPICHIEGEKKNQAEITAYGTPWCGKEGWGRRRSTPVAAVCFLRRAEEGNRIRRVSPADAVPLMLRQMFHPYEPEATGLMLDLLDQMIATLPMYLLECDISEEAVKCSFEALTGEAYTGNGIQTTAEEIDRLWRMPG